MSDDAGTATHDALASGAPWSRLVRVRAGRDEAINPLIADVAVRVAGLAADQPVVPVPSTSGT
jgi:hypothetical protein